MLSASNIGFTDSLSRQGMSREPTLYGKVRELGKVAEPLPIDTLRKYLAEATHRCEQVLGARPGRWSALMHGVQGHCLSAVGAGNINVSGIDEMFAIEIFS